MSSRAREPLAQRICRRPPLATSPRWRAAQAEAERCAGIQSAIADMRELSVKVGAFDRPPASALTAMLTTSTDRR
jgi:hypothetical protein